VAELALGLMLGLARAINVADSSMKGGQWIKKELKGVELNGKTLGIVGMGNIGSALAERAAAMGMKVLGYDPLLTPEVISGRNAVPVALDDLYARSDYISLHIPLTDETRGMIDGMTLSKMKRGVRIVCTARGNIIDETALLGALESGQVAGAALDVFSKEPPGLIALVAHPKVIATPHIGAQTAEAQVRAAEDMGTEILAALKGEPLRWKVV
jgi:D-3-phosphoglycerate dehydrogenase